MPPDLTTRQLAAKKYSIFAEFDTMNTQSARQALPNKSLAWCENLQIVGPNQLVCCNGPAASLTTIPGVTITSQFFANFTPPGGSNTDFIISFTSAGAAYQTNAANGTTVQIAVAGTFSTSPDCTTWASQRILIADSMAGYCTWDGHTFVQVGGVSPNIVVTNGGSGYGAPPSVNITGGSGSGATAHSVITGGVVTSVVLDTPGTGYKAGDTLTVTFGSGTAAATAIVWPQFSLTATTLAVFAGRVWLAGSRTLTWTGTGGFDDAKAADASGSTQITDADLVHQITALRSLNNFLYIFGDNSVKQIGTITISGSSTIFNIVSLSSDQGTPFKLAIASYNRLVLFANKVGVYAVLGASVEKVSDQMDAIFAGADLTQPFQSAVNDLHTSLHTYLLLMRFQDPVLGITRSLILCFYKNRWFVANQGNSLTTICTAPINGLIETFSSSGIDVTALFQSTTPVPIILRTSMSPNGEVIMGKMATEVVVAFNSNTLTTISGSLDTENLNPGKPFTMQSGNQLIWQNNALQTLTWQNNALQTLTWFATGFIVGRATVSGSGIFLGMTLSGTFSGGNAQQAGLVINACYIEYQDKTKNTGTMSR